MSAFADIDRELDTWRALDLAPRFWLRDDDAVEPSPALDRLLDLAGSFEIPLLLAVIPARATDALARRLETEALVSPCVHGYAHRNHMPPSEPAVELGGDRPVEEVLSELRIGRARLGQLFGDRLSGMLVPPWNRISAEVAARIDQCGFTGVSLFSWRVSGAPLPHLNTHVDVVDWRAGRTGRDPRWAAEEMTRRLSQARERGGAPIGVLAHHLVHDADAWRTLEGLIDFLRVRRGLAFGRADDLLAVSA